MAEEIGNSELVRTWANDGTIVVPSGAKIDEGWLRGEQPPHEWMNYIHNVLGQKINHALSRGAADWDNATEYFAGATVNRDGNLWLSLATNTNSEPEDANSNWYRVTAHSEGGKSLIVPGITITSNTGTGAVVGAYAVFDGSMTEIPSSQAQAVVGGWDSGTEAQRGDLLLIPRSSLADGAIRFFSGNPAAEGMVFRNGRLGINKTGPSAPLDVEGEAHVKRFEANANPDAYVTPGGTNHIFTGTHGSDGTILTISTDGNANADRDFVRFYGNGVEHGSIERGSSSTVSYLTSSDYRLKENVAPVEGALDRLSLLKPCRFNWIADPDKTIDGFLAHEAAPAVPEAVSGEKDAMRELGILWNAEGLVVAQKTPKPGELTDDQTWEKTCEELRPQMMDNSKLVPLLTAALQEATAEIADLKTRIEKLEETA